MVTNHKLLIDADCPMCKIYGKAFEQHGLVEKGTCTPYQQTTNNMATAIDMKRARNEIALHNTQTGETVYGIRAFQQILVDRFTWLKKPFGSHAFDIVLQKLYKFVSMNRKVIAPSPKRASVWECMPDLNVKYRIFYLLFAVLFSSVVLNAFTPAINTYMGWESFFGRELMVCAGQIAWQSFFFWKLGKEKIFDYLGNMMTVSIIGSLVLLPALVLNKLISIPVEINLLYFLLVVGGMTLEHFRRTKILNISILSTISWLLYRLGILWVLYL